jgi:hypothetical protein
VPRRAPVLRTCAGNAEGKSVSSLVTPIARLDRVVPAQRGARNRGRETEWGRSMTGWPIFGKPLPRSRASSEERTAERDDAVAQQPTGRAPVIDHQIARNLAIEIPPLILACADEVIE